MFGLTLANKCTIDKDSKTVMKQVSHDNTFQKVSVSNDKLDKIKGMMIGLAVGDALGAPYEFRTGHHLIPEFKGKIEHTAHTFDRYRNKTTVYPLGSYTDDTEMSLALARSLIDNKGYNSKDVAMRYMAWCNSGTTMIGKNTRALFKGIKTYKGYCTRMTKELEVPEEKRTRSNGALMRCAPISVMKDYAKISIQDTDLTNPNQTCREAELIHVTALHLLLDSQDPLSVFEQVSKMATIKEIKDVFNTVSCGGVWPYLAEKGMKGWVLNGLYCSMAALVTNKSYSDFIGYIATIKGSDSDTNACIAGAIMGAKLGYNKLLTEPLTRENIETVLKCKWTRPKEYTLCDFDQLCRGLLNLTNV